MALIDLNNLGGRQYPEERDHGGSSGQTEYLFRGLRRRLLRLFEEATQNRWACFGAVAWLTDPLILDAMAKLPCSVIVQKEDFLRPDLDAEGADRETWTSRLHRQYETIRDSDSIGPAGAYFQRQHMPWPLCAMSESGDPEIAGVRCFGLQNDRSGDPARRRPLMHLKFLVFAEPVLGPDGEGMQETVSWKGRGPVERVVQPQPHGLAVLRGRLHLPRPGHSRRAYPAVGADRRPVGGSRLDL